MSLVDALTLMLAFAFMAVGLASYLGWRSRKHSSMKTRDHRRVT